MIEKVLKVIACCLFTNSIGKLRTVVGIPEVFFLNIALHELVDSNVNQVLLFHTFFLFRNCDRKNYSMKNTTKFENKNFQGNKCEEVIDNLKYSEIDDYRQITKEVLHSNTSNSDSLFVDLLLSMKQMTLKAKSIIISLSTVQIILSHLFQDETLLIIEELMNVFHQIGSLITLEECLYAIFIILALLLLQWFAFLINNKNLARKNFHFFFFFICLKNSSAYLLILQVLIYISALISKSGFVTTFLRCFLNQNIEKDSFSLLLLVGSVTYPYFFLPFEDYTRVIISICILDSFAAITGVFLKSKTRTFSGFFVGQLSSYITEYIIFKRVDFCYHILMGLVELYCPWSDNITLSATGILFQNYRRFILTGSFKP